MKLTHGAVLGLFFTLSLAMGIGMIIGVNLEPPKYIDSHIPSNVEKNFENCMTTDYEVEMTVTVDTSTKAFIPHDIRCPSNRIDRNFQGYVSTDGFYFDSPMVFFNGDLIKIKGVLYLYEDKIVLGAKQTVPISIKIIPDVPTPTPTAQSVIVVTPTPNRD